MAESTSLSETHDAVPLSNGTLIRRLLQLAWGYRRATVVILLMQVCLLAMAVGGLGLLGLGIDLVGYELSQKQPELELGLKAPTWPLGVAVPEAWSALDRVALVALLIVMLGGLRFLLERASQIGIATLVQNLVVDLRGQVYDKLQRLSFRFFNENDSGSLINRVTGDVMMVRLFIDRVLIQVVMLLLSLVFFAGYMLSLNVMLTLVCMATTPLLWLLTGYFGRRVKPAYEENRKLFDEAIRVLSENARGVHVVKGFARQDLEKDKFNAASEKASQHKRWIFNQVSFFVPLIMAVSQLNLVVLLVAGGYVYIHDPSFSFGDLIVFAGLLQQFSQQVGNVAEITNAVQASMTGARRVFEVLDAPEEVSSPLNAQALGKVRGRVVFEDVSFAYAANETPALGQVNLVVEPGECIAVLGATGSGKSTLLLMLPRFYDPTSGRVTLDGHDLRSLSLQELRRNVGIVFQESFLFSNSVAENIAFGQPQATAQQVQQAAEIAQAHDFITHDLAQGYDTVLTEGGGNLSGGQRQRIAIARALLLDPPILILDDPTAAIDPDTEHEILDAMDRAMRGRTTFVVAHRLSTLRRADRIVVMEAGQMVQCGTHDELMVQPGLYREAALVQAADEKSRRLLGLPVQENVKGGEV
ncbi:MAG: ABC transporter ATP-binding protein [Algisphaera sp.]